jgi:hypothetical protein
MGGQSPGWFVLLLLRAAFGSQEATLGSQEGDLRSTFGSPEGLIGSLGTEIAAMAGGQHAASCVVETVGAPDFAPACGTVGCPCENEPDDGESIRVFAGQPSSFFTCSQKAADAKAALIMVMADSYMNQVPSVIENLLRPTDSWVGIGGRPVDAQDAITFRAVYIVVDYPAGKKYSASRVRAMSKNGTSALQSFISKMHSRFEIPIAAEFLLTDTCIAREICKHYYRFDPKNTEQQDCLRWSPLGAGLFDPTSLKSGMWDGSDTWNFKNSAAYMFGFARIGAFARYVVHVDADWRVKLVTQSDWAQSAIAGGNWVERAVNALTSYTGSYVIEVSVNDDEPHSKVDFEGGGSKLCSCSISLQAFVLDTELFRSRLLPTSFGHTEGSLTSACETHRQHGDAQVCTIHKWGSSVLGVEKWHQGK